MDVFYENIMCGENFRQPRCAVEHRDACGHVPCSADATGEDATSGGRCTPTCLGMMGWAAWEGHCKYGLESSRAESRVMALGQDIFGFVAKNWWLEVWQIFGKTEKNQAFCCVTCVVDLPGFCRGLEALWMDSGSIPLWFPPPTIP